MPRTPQVPEDLWRSESLFRNLLIAVLMPASVLLGSTGIPSAASAAPAQATAAGAGTITGSVTDPTGASIPGATVTLKNPVTNYQRDVKTDANGAFQFLNVPHNQYHLAIEAPGFRPGIKAVSVRTAVPIQLDIQLSISSEIEQITVQSGAPDIVEPVPTAHTDVDHDLMAKLP